MSKTFRKLTPAQLAVFEQIATGNDGGHHSATLKALERRGVIESEWVKEGYANIKRYFVPLPIHMEWCQWCAEQPEEAAG